MQDRIFFGICFGFIFGVLLRSFVAVNTFVVILIGVISLAVILYFFVTPKLQGNEGDPLSFGNWGIVAGIFVLAFSLGILRLNLAEKNIGMALDQWSGNQIVAGESVSLSGMIADEPDVRENNQKLTIAVDNSNLKVLLTTDLTENYRYGDDISFYGKLEKPENFITNTGKVFDYVDYLRKDGIVYVMNYSKIGILSRDNGSKLKSALFSLKENFLDKVNLAIAKPENLLMDGLILGDKSQFNSDFTQEFINTGTIHVVALSGYNVTIVAEWIMKVFAFLPLGLGIALGILAILLFIIMTGASSTAIRAGVMATLALIARWTGRNYDVLRAMVLAGIFMILLNPYVLVFDVSFQLSFLATIGVVFVAPRIEKYFTWVTKKFELRDIVSVTCATYIFVFPFILYQMGNLSLVALPANVLVLPFIPITMLFGFITGGLGFVWYIFAAPVGFLSYILLHYEMGVINFFAALPFASLSIPNFPLLLTLAIYAYFIYRLFGRSIKKFFVSIDP